VTGRSGQGPLQRRAHPRGQRGRVVRAADQRRQHEPVEHGGDLPRGGHRVVGTGRAERRGPGPAQRVAAGPQRGAQGGVADGGEVVVYARHVTRLAAMHPEIEQIGYHCRDYFVQQWDRFQHVPWSVLAHSTHVRGAGSYDAATGLERSRVTVTLATGVPEQTVRAAGLGYLHPDAVDLEVLARDPGTLVVPNAGEVLHRLR